MFKCSQDIRQDMLDKVSHFLVETDFEGVSKVESIKISSSLLVLKVWQSIDKKPFVISLRMGMSKLK